MYKTLQQTLHSREKPDMTSLHVGTGQGYLILSLLFNIGVEALDIATRKEKEIKELGGLPWWHSG